MSSSDSPPSSLPSIPDTQPSTSRGGFGVHSTSSTTGTEKVVRGRGRGRPRSRQRGRSGSRGRSTSRGQIGRGGRGRGRGRGAQQPALAEDRLRIAERREARKKQTMDAINKVSHEKLKEIMAMVVEREPSLVFDLCAAAPIPPPDSSPPVPEGTYPEWCVCHNCEEMETDVEKLCCGCSPDSCISKRLEMDTIVLDQQALAIGDGYFRDMLGRHAQPMNNYNETMRFTAYRNFTLWRHGRLGAGVRRVVPSCVVMKIQRTFPSASGRYTGFRRGRFQ